MFGFFSAPRHHRRYRQVYAAYCSHQRQQYGVFASLFTSYEAILLYCYAMEQGLCAAPASKTPTCCRFRNDWANHWGLDLEIADYCSAFAILLASVKLDDDRRDSGRLASRLAQRCIRTATQRSNQFFDSASPGLVEKIRGFVDAHVQLEAESFVANNQADLLRYAEPTARAFGTVFSAVATHCQNRGQNVDVARFEQIGQWTGAAILVSDCMFDFQSDGRRGEFNPLKNLDGVSRARLVSLSLVSRLGWEFGDTCGDNSVCRSIAGRAFERINKFSIEKKSSTPVTQLHRRPFFGVSPVADRSGDCDCFGDCCGEMCLQGCTDLGGGVDGCNCCCDCYACDCYACDCARDRESRKKKDAANAATDARPGDLISATAVSNLIGKIGFAATSLQPAGIIHVNGQTLSATTKHAPVAEGDSVKIVAEGSFGFIVEPITT